MTFGYQVNCRASWAYRDVLIAPQCSDLPPLGPAFWRDDAKNMLLNSARIEGVFSDTPNSIGRLDQYLRP